MLVLYISAYFDYRHRFVVMYCSHLQRELRLCFPSPLTCTMIAGIASHWQLRYEHSQTCAFSATVALEVKRNYWL